MHGDAGLELPDYWLSTLRENPMKPHSLPDVVWNTTALTIFFFTLSMLAEMSVL